MDEGGRQRQDQLYIGLSTVLDWQGAEHVDSLYQASATTVDGHPALAASPGAELSWGQVDVGIGGAHDPAVEFRGPTMAIATSLASLVTPRILGLAP